MTKDDVIDLEKPEPFNLNGTKLSEFLDYFCQVNY